MKEVFERIYAENIWGNAESRSGDGSAAEHTASIRAALPKIIADFGIRSMLDVPCGDFNWMRLLDLDIDYIGGDIVPGLIEANRRAYAKPGLDFQHIDITKSPLPQVDLILCRDIFVHLSFEDIKSALNNIARSGIRYILATTFPSREANADIVTGEWRPLNLLQAPFSFPPPMRLIEEHCKEWDGYWADKSLGLWEVSTLTAGKSGSIPASSRPPRVSVIIPTFNRAHYIGRAVASALGQSFTDLEVIVVDDGSTDNTPDVISTFNDSRLIYIRQKNAGRSQARNLAMSKARGEYITFLDSDDYYLPSKVERQVEFLDANPEYGMAYTAASGIDGEGKTINYLYEAPISGWIYPSIAFFQPLTITLPTVMVRSALLREVGPFDEAMARFEDTDMWRRIAKVTPIAALNEITCHIRTHDGNRLAMLDPSEIASAIDHYVSKVLTEDTDINSIILDAGVRRLYEHYGTVMTSVPAFASIGQALIAKGRSQFQPLVSVVIPVFNGANYLAGAIDSILAQTYQNIEIIVVNDGSTDNGATERVALSYGDRVKYFTQVNGGVANALNRAIREARGEYISWLSHDDLYTPDKIEKQIACLVQQADPSQCIIYGDYTVFTHDSDLGSSVSMPHVLPEDFQYFITIRNVLHGCTLLIPKGAFTRHGLFDERLRTTQDYDLWFRMAAQENFIHLPGTVVRARAHAEQGTHALRDVVMKEADELLTRFVDNLTPQQVERGASCPATLGYLDIAASCYSRKFFGAARRSVELAYQAASSIHHQIEDSRTLKAPQGGNTNDALKSLIDAIGQRCLRSLATEQKCEDLALRLDAVMQERDVLRAALETAGRYNAGSEVAQDEVKRLCEEQDRLRAEIQNLQGKLDGVYASSSWRATRPLRLFGRLRNRITNAI